MNSPQKDANGRDYFVVQGAGTERATVYLQGAHVTHWETASGLKPIYLSPTAVFADGKALRGGVPICWPQFSDMGKYKQAHGVARNRVWSLIGSGKGDALFRLVVGPDDPELPGIHADLIFGLACVGDELDLALTVCNAGVDTLEFTTALHTYFSVSDITKLQISGGLDEARWADNLQNRRVFDPAPIHNIDKEVDRIYFDVKNPVLLHDGSTQISIQGHDLPDAVLWNPWIEKTKKMSDLPDDGYQKFVCVEHGKIQSPVVLGPKEKWTGRQHITCRNL